jgi:hypothetical protein
MENTNALTPLSFQDIPQLPRAYYEVDVGWDALEANLERYDKAYGLVLEPDFQRAHVWTREQQSRYIEYILRGGEVGRGITFNCVGFMGRGAANKMEIVDGKQRLEAVRAFFRDEVLAFGRKRSEFTGIMSWDFSFRFRICRLKTRAEILELYLNINAGGTPHTSEELDRVREMLKQAK